MSLLLRQRALLFCVFMRSLVTGERATPPQMLLCFSQRAVMGRWSTQAVLLLLLIGQISAESSSSNCQHLKTLHERMDGVEKRLEDSVKMLQSEVSLLLAAVEGHERIPLLDTPANDILEQPPPHDGHTG